MAKTPAQPVIGRFAPSPSGRMHAGNIFSALVSWLVVRLQVGKVVLRIEDLDRERCRAEHSDRIMADFESLGLTWDEGPFYQSDRSAHYDEAIAELFAKGLLYPCFCTRTDLHVASAPHEGHGLVYAGTCRDLTEREQKQRLEERRANFKAHGSAAAYEPALRLRCPDEIIEVDDLFQGVFCRDLARECGDFVVRRSNGEASYHLASVLDDADEGVNCVVRGCDLLPATPQQIHLQRALGLETPVYGHVALLVDENGTRLAKRHRSASFEELLARRKSPRAVLGSIAFATGLIDEEEPVRPVDVLQGLTMASLIERLRGKIAIEFTP